jgi:hypothetical protein
VSARDTSATDGEERVKKKLQQRRKGENYKIEGVDLGL